MNYCIFICDILILQFTGDNLVCIDLVLQPRLRLSRK